MSLDPSNRIVELRTHRCKGAGFNHGPFLIDERMQTVECGTCGAVLNASYVLAEIGRWENRIAMTLDRYKKEATEAIGRNSTKCEHCKGMTRIVK